MDWRAKNLTLITALLCATSLNPLIDMMCTSLAINAEDKHSLGGYFDAPTMQCRISWRRMAACIRRSLRDPICTHSELLNSIKRLFDFLVFQVLPTIKIKPYPPFSHLLSAELVRLLGDRSLIHISLPKKTLSLKFVRYFLHKLMTISPISLLLKRE